MVWFWSKTLKGEKISYDAHEVTALSQMHSRTWTRTVRRGEVKTMIERRNGLFLSERGRIGAFFWGGIFIPRTFPEYDELKCLTESWKKP